MTYLFIALKISFLLIKSVYVLFQTSSCRSTCLHKRQKTETKMRLKILIVIFLPFYWALQWTIHEGKALDDTPGWWTVISRFSTLEDAKNECLTNPECVGITKNQLGYELRKGSVLSSRQTSTTYMKSFIQWIEHTGKIISGSGLDSFGTLDEAKNKCIDRLNNSNYFIFSRLMRHTLRRYVKEVSKFNP